MCFVFQFYDNKRGRWFGSDRINSADGGCWWCSVFVLGAGVVSGFCFKFEGFTQILHLTQFDTITVRNSNSLRHSTGQSQSYSLSIAKQRIPSKGNSTWIENDLPGGCFAERKDNVQWYLKSFIQIEKKKGYSVYKCNILWFQACLACLCEKKNNNSALVTHVAVQSLMMLPGSWGWLMDRKYHFGTCLESIVRAEVRWGERFLCLLSEGCSRNYGGEERKKKTHLLEFPVHKSDSSVWEELVSLCSSAAE